MSERVGVVGVGMILFVKPGANGPYPAMAVNAGRLTLVDADVDCAAIQHAYVG